MRPSAVPEARWDAEVVTVPGLGLVQTKEILKKNQSPSNMGEIHEVFDEEAFNQILVKLSFDSWIER